MTLFVVQGWGQREGTGLHEPLRTSCTARTHVSNPAATKWCNKSNKGAVFLFRFALRRRAVLVNLHPILGRCERVLHFMGREVQGRWKFRMKAVKWVVTKLQGDETASSCTSMSGRKVTGRWIGIPVFHGTLLPMDFWTRPRFLRFGRVPKYHAKGCSHYWGVKNLGSIWLKCCKNQCSGSRAVNRSVWTLVCVMLWGWLSISWCIWMCESLSKVVGQCSWAASKALKVKGISQPHVIIWLAQKVVCQSTVDAEMIT